MLCLKPRYVLSHRLAVAAILLFALPLATQSRSKHQDGTLQNLAEARWNDFQHLTVKLLRKEGDAVKEYDAGDIFTVAKGDSLKITPDPIGFQTSNETGWILAIAFLLKQGAPEVGNWKRPIANGDFTMVGDYAFVTLTPGDEGRTLTLANVPRAGCVPTFMLIPASSKPERNKDIVKNLANSLRNLGGLGTNIATLQGSSNRLQRIEDFLIKFVGGLATGEKQKVNKPEVVASVAQLFGMSLDKNDATFKADPIRVATEKAKTISSIQPFKLDVDTVGNLAQLSGQQLGNLLHKHDIDIGNAASEILNVSIVLLNMVKSLKANYVFIPTVDKKTSEGAILSDAFNTHLFSTTSPTFNKSSPSRFDSLLHFRSDNTYQVFLFSPFLLTEPNFRALPFDIDAKNICLTSKTPLAVGLKAVDQSLLINSKFVFKLRLIDGGGKRLPDVELVPDWIERRLTGSIDEESINKVKKAVPSTMKAGLSVSSTSGKPFFETPEAELKELSLPTDSVTITEPSDGRVEAETQHDLSLGGPIPCIGEVYFGVEANKPLSVSANGNEIVKNNGKFRLDLSKIGPVSGFLFVKRTDRSTPDKIPVSVIEHSPKIQKVIVHEGEDQVIVLGNFLERIKEIKLVSSTQADQTNSVSVTADMLCSGARNIVCARIKSPHRYKAGDNISLMYVIKDSQPESSISSDVVAVRRPRVNSTAKVTNSIPERTLPDKVKVVVPAGLAFYTGKTSILFNAQGGTRFDRGFRVEIRSKALGSASKRSLEGLDVTDTTIEVKNVVFSTLLGTTGYGEIEYRIIDSDDTDDYPDDLYWKPLVQAVRVPSNMSASVVGTNVSITGDFLERVKTIKSESAELISNRDSGTIKFTISGKPIMIYFVDAPELPVQVELQQ